MKGALSVQTFCNGHTDSSAAHREMVIMTQLKWLHGNRRQSKWCRGRGSDGKSVRLHRDSA